MQLKFKLFNHNRPLSSQTWGLVSLTSAHFMIVNLFGLTHIIGFSKENLESRYKIERSCLESTWQLELRKAFLLFSKTFSDTSKSALRGPAYENMVPRLMKCFFLPTIFLFVLFPPILACRCLPMSLPQEFYFKENVNFVKARVMKIIEPPSQFGVRRIVASVQRTYKGCHPTTHIILHTAASSASCGVHLQVDESYILPLSAASTPSVNSCQV